MSWANVESSDKQKLAVYPVDGESRIPTSVEQYEALKKGFPGAEYGDAPLASEEDCFLCKMSRCAPVAARLADGRFVIYHGSKETDS